MTAVRFVFGFIGALLDHAVRIAVWSAGVMLAAALLGMPPIKSLVLVIAANVAGCLFYRV